TGLLQCSMTNTAYMYIMSYMFRAIILLIILLIILFCMIYKLLIFYKLICVIFFITLFFFFFFQAEDGIRDRNVTGVQTCALPISCGGVNGDGIVNIGDALVVAQFDVGLRPCSQLEHPEVCDVNRDGACNIGDA